MWRLLAYLVFATRQRAAAEVPDICMYSLCAHKGRKTVAACHLTKPLVLTWRSELRAQIAHLIFFLGDVQLS